jgi:hypothetical protein
MYVTWMRYGCIPLLQAAEGLRSQWQRIGEKLDRLVIAQHRGVHRDKLYTVVRQVSFTLLCACARVRASLSCACALRHCGCVHTPRAELLLGLTFCSASERAFRRASLRGGSSSSISCHPSSASPSARGRRSPLPFARAPAGME